MMTLANSTWWYNAVTAHLRNTTTDVYHDEMSEYLLSELIEDPEATFRIPHQILSILVTLLVLFSGILELSIMNKVTVFPANRAFLYSLALSDIMQAGVVFPLSISTAIRREWTLAPYVCVYQITASVYLWLTGIFSLAFVNIDHYIAVTEPSHYQQQLGPRKSACWIVFIWILGLCYTLPLLLIGPEKVVLCSTDIVFCVLNYRAIAAYSVSVVGILIPPPVFIFMATGFRGFIHQPDDTATASKERLIMYKANTAAGVVTLILWGLGLSGAGGVDLPPLYRLIAFWFGASAPFWRVIIYWITASPIIRSSYLKQKAYEKS